MPLTICSGATSLPVVLLMRLYPTGSMLRSSSQSKSMPLLVVAETSETGICTSPKLMAPFQIARAMTDLPDDDGTGPRPLSTDDPARWAKVQAPRTLPARTTEKTMNPDPRIDGQIRYDHRPGRALSGSYAHARKTLSRQDRKSVV